MKTFKVKVPEFQADDEFGRWMEAHNVRIHFQVMLGTYYVSVTWSKFHSYSDAGGSHHEEWSLSHRDRSLPKALDTAIRAAMKRQAEPT